MSDPVSKVHVHFRKRCELTTYGAIWTYRMERYVGGKGFGVEVYLSHQEIVENRLHCANELRRARHYLTALIKEYKGRFL